MGYWHAWVNSFVPRGKKLGSRKNFTNNWDHKIFAPICNATKMLLRSILCPLPENLRKPEVFQYPQEV